MTAKSTAVVRRIESLDQDLRKGLEYLQSGRHADWHGFRPLFGRKRDLPPHADWVRNVFLPRREKALARADKLLQRLGDRDRPGAG